MSIPVILIISMAAALGGSILKKNYLNFADGGMKSVFVYNGVGCMVSAVILLCWGGFGSASVFTVLLGILFGVVTSLQAVLNLKALQIGPMSYTTVIISFSTIITALSGVLFFNETIAPVQFVGIAMMLVSFVLAVEKKKDEKSASLKWLILCLSAFLCSGSIGLMQKVHQRSVYKNELNAFLIIAFAAAFVFSSAVIVILHIKDRKSSQMPAVNGKTALKWLIIGNIILGGACVAVNNKLNLYLSGVMDSAVFFPIVNGGGVALVTLAAVVIFREKLTLKQWIGIAFGVASIVFLCNPFR